ncbi:MAG: TetR family transcriptional regulator [Pseudomonadota bacterium]
MKNDAKGAHALIINAFNRLLLTKRVKPRVTEIIAEAGVARSTFYEHFEGRDSLLMEALRGPLSVVADAVAVTGDETKLRAILDHFRENRREAAGLLEGPLRARVVRSLAELIAVRLDAALYNPSFDLHLADMQIGLMRLWLTGETRHTSRELAHLMIRSASAQKAAMVEPETH